MENSIESRRGHSFLRSLLYAAVITIFLMMVMGSVVRVNNAAQACPDWPTCYGQLSMPANGAAQLQMIHRALAVLAGLLTAGSALLVLLRFAGRRWVAGLLSAASLLMLAQALLGASLTQGAAATPLHLGLGLAALGLASAALTINEWQPHINRLALRSPYARLAGAALLSIFVLMVSGSLVTAVGLPQACTGWPLCSGGLPVDGAGWLQLGHRVVTGAVSVLLVLQFLRGWRTQRSQRVMLTAASAVFALFVGQVLLGALKVTRGFPTDLVVLHAASAMALWAVQVVLVTAAGITRRTAADEAREAAEQGASGGERARDFLRLSKPIIVALLLVTTYAGMVVGGRGLPSLALTFWTLLGGALAAGGSSALNQYIDRELDKNMQRTAKRPLPSGRLTAAEGLAFGAAACLLAFFVLAGFVNLLAALLSLAGMIYYVLLYSIWLKHLTVQNIVIGGGAGAIPPLVGWAAASGALNVPSLFLFAIIFFWTPPHFWALALLRQNDYARAGVPMMPVVRGAAATRLQIFIYTLELVGLTLLMPIFKLTGSFFLVAAVLLGGLLIYAAWRVLRKGSNKTFYWMYRYSSMYLALLFLAMMLDVLI